MKIKRSGNLFRVESSEGGRYYSVDLKKNICDCPAFSFRKKECKHLQAVRNFLAEESEDQDAQRRILALVRAKGEINDIELIQEFGEEKINEMIRLGELLERNGKIRILE